MNSFVGEKNGYFQSAAAAPRTFSLHSVSVMWKDVTVQEMSVQRYEMTTGLVSQPEMRSYWSTDPVIAIPLFYTCMSQNTFEQILQFVHVVDNTNQPAQDDLHKDKLFKIRPFLTACKDCYYPWEILAVDESMMPWKGILWIKQYIPSNCVKAKQIWHTDVFLLWGRVRLHQQNENVLR